MNVAKVCGVPMGGEQGENPTLMIGSIFYDGHEIVSDPSAGLFDMEQARKAIDLQTSWAEKTGLPSGLDVVASTPEAMKSYLDFVADYFGGPVIIDSSSAEVKIAGVRRMADKGLSGRVIYNSVSLETTDEEFKTIKECNVTTAVALMMAQGDFSAEGKIRLMTSENGPIARARECGIENIFVDPGIIDLPSVGTAKVVMAAAKKLGYFCGSGIHNALGTWPGLKTKIGKSFKPTAKAVLNALSTAWDGDFLLYGPLTDAPLIFPAVAVVDAILSQQLVEKGVMPDMRHPIFKIA